MEPKAESLDRWITSKKAAEILTKKSGHTVTDNYVRRMGKLGRIERKEIDARTMLYLRADVEAIQVKERGDGSIRKAARAPRGTRPEQVEQGEQKQEEIA